MKNIEPQTQPLGNDAIKSPLAMQHTVASKVENDLLEFASLLIAEGKVSVQPSVGMLNNENC